MSVLGTGDNTLAMMQLDQQNLIQKKLDMDNLKGRLMGAPDKKEKLREACQGFESVFIQKMWEQMRNNVQKSGYLHSRDEHMYQGMYDAEFSKKMTEAGGIGLADMLYEQLSQRLGESSRTTSPRNSPRLPIVPSSSSISALGSAPIPLDNADAQAGLPLNNRQIRPLYEDVQVAQGAGQSHGQASTQAFGQPHEAYFAEFDESLTDGAASGAMPENIYGAAYAVADAEAEGAGIAAKEIDTNDELDFESISQALLAEELAAERAAAPTSGNNLSPENARPAAGDVFARAPESSAELLHEGNMAGSTLSGSTVAGGIAPGGLATGASADSSAGTSGKASKIGFAKPVAASAAHAGSQAYAAPAPNPNGSAQNSANASSLNNIAADDTPLSPADAAILEAALRQNMAEAGRITVAQAPASPGRLGTAFATDRASSADSAADFDFNKVPRS